MMHHIHLTQSLTELFDAVTAVPAAETIVLHIPATETPALLLHFSSGLHQRHDHQGTSAAGASGVAAVAAGTEAQHHAAVQASAALLGKICELLFTRTPGGAIAVVERPSRAAATSGGVADEEGDGASSVSLYCSGPALALAAACSHKLFEVPQQQVNRQQQSAANGAKKQQPQPQRNDDINFWFGDAAALGVPCYGGLTHTLREWLGTTVAIPMLVLGKVLPLHVMLRGAANTALLPASGEPADTEKVLAEISKKLLAEHRLRAGNASNAASAAAAVADSAGGSERLTQGYGTFFSGVSWLRARKTIRMHMAISAQNSGRRGTAEIELLKLFIGKGSVAPKSFKALLEGEAEATGRALEISRQASASDLMMSVLSIASRNFFQPVPSLFLRNGAGARSPAVFNAVFPTATSFSIFLQREFEKRLLASSSSSSSSNVQIRVFSLNQAMSQLAIEAENGGSAAHASTPARSPQTTTAATTTSSFFTGSKTTTTSSSSSSLLSGARFVVVSILLWDVPLFADPAQSPDGSAMMGTTPGRIATERMTRCFLPEVRIHIQHHHSGHKSTTTAVQQRQQQKDVDSLVAKITAILHQSSSRLVRPVFVFSAMSSLTSAAAAGNSDYNNNLLLTFPGLRLFAESLRQVMLCIEDGALPIVVHKALQLEGAMTPTLLQRVDRDGDTLSALELLSALVAVDAAKTSTAASSSSSSSPVHLLRRRTGTAVLAEMVKQGPHGGTSRFHHFLRDRSDRRLDDLPLTALLYTVSAQQQKQRRFFDPREIVNRVATVGASFPFKMMADDQQVQQQHGGAAAGSVRIAGGTEEADRLAGAVLGFSPAHGGSPLKYCVLQQIRSLKRQQRLNTPSAAPKQQDSTAKQSGAVTAVQRKAIDFVAEMQLWASSAVLGPETIDPLPVGLESALRSLGGVPVLQAKL